MKKSNNIAIIFVISLLISQFFCTKEAPTVNPADYIEPTVPTTQPGYSYPMVTAVYPPDTSTDVSINTTAVIAFNIPIDTGTISGNITVESPLGTFLAEGVDFSWTSTNNYVTINFINAFNPIPNNSQIRVNIGSGILDVENSIALYNPQSFTFTTTDVADTTAPLLSGNSPTGGAELVTTNVQITFNETIDPSTINKNTFYLENNSDNSLVEATYSYSDPTATLTPSVNLLPDTEYEVWITTGVEDLSNNPYAGPTYSWTFTTQTIDAIPGSPSIAGSGPSISSISDINAIIDWTTDEYTNCSIDYDTGDDFATFVNIPDPDPVTYELVFNRSLGGGLSDGTRYFYRINLEDEYANPATSATYQFNTLTTDTPTEIVGGANYQQSINYIPQTASVANSGAFIFWSDYDSPTTYRHIQGNLYNSAFAQQWGAGGIDVFSEGGELFYYRSAVEDEVGGVIVLASHSSGLYAKRINSGGTFFNWGTSADQATDRGFEINTASSNYFSAAPVYSGFFSSTVVSNRTTDMNMTNAFFDFGQDFSSVADNDIAIDTTNHDGTLVTTGSNYRYALNQTTPGTIIPTNTYRIVDGNTNFSNDTAENHSGNSAYTLADGATTIYSNNNYVAQAWTNWGVNGDFIRVNATYARITSRNTIINFVDSGNANSDVTDHLVDTTASWGDGTGLVAVNDIATETGSGDYARISNVTNIDLTLADIGDGSDIFPFGTEPYEIYDEYDSLNVGDEFNNFYQYTVDTNVNIASNPAYTIYNYLGVSGTADTPPANPLYDDGYDFSSVAVDDIVFNSSTGAWTYVTDVTYAAYGALDLNVSIMSNGNTYSIFRITAGYTRSDIVDNGLAGASTTSNVLYDSSTVAAVGDIVYNVTDGTYSVISSISAGNYYRLAGNPGFAPNEGYIILRPNTTTDLKNVLYAWQEGTAVHWRIFTMDDTPPTAVNTEQTIANARNPQVVSNGLGNAFIIYEDTSSASNIYANRRSAAGTSLGTTDIDTGSTNESILKIIKDNAGGFVILYNRNATNNLQVQRINSSGVAQWGGAGRAVGNPIASISNVDMVYNGGNDVIVVAQINDNIWARRIGTVWTDGAVAAGQYISNPAGTSIQQKPKIYTNWTDAIIVWEDNRFAIGCGYGIFGMRLDAVTGVKNSSWDADAGASADMHGVSIILNSDNVYWPSPALVPYNNGNRVQLLWEDWRTVGEESNIESYNLYDGATWFAPW